MSIYKYLQLQPVDPQDDGTTSDLDEYSQDETIALTDDVDEHLDESWDKILQDLTADPHDSPAVKK